MMEGSEPPLARNHSRAVPEELVVVPWVDPVVDETGYGPRSMYVESVWLPVLGPTATWLYRRLGSWVETADCAHVRSADLAFGLGVGEALGVNSALARSIGRLAMFRAARWEDQQLAVRRKLPPLPEWYVRQRRGQRG